MRKETEAIIALAVLGIFGCASKEKTGKKINVKQGNFKLMKFQIMMRPLIDQLPESKEFTHYNKRIRLPYS